MSGRALALLALLLACASTAVAQTSETGVVRGRVRDDAGVALAGVQLSVALPDGSYRRSAVTDSAGAFHLSLLPPGSYRVMARRVGYQPVQVTDIRIAAGEARSLEITMRQTAAELAPVIVRSDELLDIRRGDTESRTKVLSAEIGKLPVGLELDRVVALTPGARPDQLWGGASVQANGYQLDGLAFNHPGIGGSLLQPSLSWLEEVEVRGLGAGAQYGSFIGGLVNVVTKSGTNTRQGSVRAYLEANGAGASNLGRSEVIPEVAARQLFEGELRGPILRDRMFYFVSGQVLNTESRALDHLGVASGGRFSPLEQREREIRLLGKATWNTTPSDLVNVMLTVGRADGTHHGLSGRETSEATQKRTAPALLANASWQRSMGDDSYLDARALYYDTRDDRTPSAGGSVPAIQTYQLATFRHHQNALFTDRQRARGAAMSASWRDGFAQGSWTEKVRAGLDLGVGDYRELHTRNGGMSWRPRLYQAFDPANPATWHSSVMDIPSSWGGETRLGARVVNGALWIEDEFGAGRLTMIRGVRVGTFDGWLDYAASGFRTKVWDTFAWEPRLGITLDLSRHYGRDLPPTLVLKGHWGRYHQHLFAQMFDRAEAGSVHTDQELWEYRGPAFANPGRVFTPAERDSMAALGEFRLMERAELSQSGPVADIEQPYVDQTVLGLEKAVGARWKVEALYVYRSNRNAIALVDRNRDRNYTAFDSIRVTDHFNQPILGPDGRPIVIPTLYIRNDAILNVLRNHWPNVLVPGFSRIDTLRLTYDPDYHLQNAPELRREFRQVQLNLSASFPRWSGVLSFAYTDLFGNQASVAGYDEQAIYGRDDVTGRGPGFLVRMNEQGNSYGKLENFTPWEVKARVSGTLPFGLTGGAFFQHRYGDRTASTFTLSRLGYNWVRLSPVDTLHGLLIAPVTGERVYVNQRGSQHYGDNTLLDLRLERAIVGFGAREWSVSVDAFNVLGDRAATRVNTALESQSDVNASSTYSTVLGRIPPRTFRVATTLRF